MKYSARSAVGGLLISLMGTGFISWSAQGFGQELRHPTAIRVSPDRLDTSTFGLSTQRTSSAEARPAYPLRLVWSRQLPRDINYAWRQAERSTPQLVAPGLNGLTQASPASTSSDGLKLLLGSSHTRGLRVLDARAGATQQTIALRGGVETPVTFEPISGDLLVGDNAGYVYRFKPDGTKVWEYESLGPILSSVGVGEGLAYIHAMDGALVALDLDSGKAVWSYRRDGSMSEGLPIFGASTPVVAGGLVVAGFEDGHVVAVNAKDGSLAWDYLLVDEEHWQDVDGEALILDSDRLVISAYRGATVCLKISTGEALWKATTGGGARPLSVGERLIVPDSDGLLVALDSRTGEKLWTWEIPGKSVPQTPVLWRGKLVVTTADGNVYMLEPETGQLKYTLNADVQFTGFSSRAVPAGDVLFVVSDGGWVHALGAVDYQQPIVDPAQAASIRSMTELSPLL